MTTVGGLEATAARSTSATRHADRRAHRLRYGLSVVIHLISQDFRTRYRRAVLGWLWSFGQPLLRFSVLLFVFTQILKTGVPDFPQYLFIGLVFWTWFASGINAATASPMTRRNLLLRPGLPRWSVPLTAIGVEAIDLLAALPVLIVLLLAGDGIPLTAAGLPLVLIPQAMLMLSIGMLAAVANIYFHDVRLTVDVVLTLGFYLTPIVYSIDLVPEAYQGIIQGNPMTILLGYYRTILVEGGRIDPMSYGLFLAGVVALFVVSQFLFERGMRRGVDQL